MKTKSINAHLKHSIISALVLVIFAFLATSSLGLFFSFGIDVQKFHLGNGVYEEVEYHPSSDKEITTTGAEDEQGRWHGWVDIKYTTLDNEDLIYKERVYMVHGRRNGICTRTYPDGRVEEEHYISGVKISKNKSAQSGMAQGSAFSLVQARHPWYLFMLEAFEFDKQYVENYLDTLEALLGSYTFEPAEFDDYYDQVQDSLSETPYDSLIVSTTTLIGSIGIRRMKDDELRLAVIDRYRSEGSSTFDILESSYPNYVKEMSGQGVIAADLETFCNELDDTLSLYGNLDPTDAFFVDSVDSHFIVSLSSFLNTAKSQSPLKGTDSGNYSVRNVSPIFMEFLSTLGASSPASTPAEVAEVALSILTLHLLEGDIMRKIVRDTYLGNLGIPGLPLAGTEFVSGNSATSVTLNGYVIEDGGAVVSARGIAWAEHYNPVVNDNAEISGSGIGQFSVTLDGLTEGKTYYARAYATNVAGTVYGNIITFKAVSTVGIKASQAGNRELTLYPNPASGSITLNFVAGSNDGLEVIILDLSGRIVQRIALGYAGGGPREISIDVSGIQNGLYRCHLFEEGVPVAGRELIIAR